MKRPYLRVTPGDESLIAGDIPDTIASFHKLIRSDSEPLRHRLNPFHSLSPPRFEFVALSISPDASVEFLYGADDHLDALEQRLRSIYPPSFDIDRVEVDITKRLIRPVEFSREEFAERFKEGRLYYNHGQSADVRATFSDGEDMAVASASTETDLTDTDRSKAVQTGADVDDIDLAATGPLEEDEPLTALDRPKETADGSVYARPPLSEVEPYGVEWWGAAARRKDWMTTLTGFTEVLGQDLELEYDGRDHTRLPLVPLVKQLADANRPIAFQMVFQRRSDWSRDARRRSGELLDGTDTLLQKILGLESQGSRRRSGSGRSSHQSTRATSRSSPPRGTGSPADVGQSRPTGVEEASRYDLVAANSPKRTFTVNIRLLTLAVDGEEADGFAAMLDPLRSVFDLVDGPFYEMDGQRLRAQGYLPGSGERHARNVLDRFDSRSISAGGRRFAFTNRSETRPDLVLNGNELANFIVIPPATELPSPPHQSNGNPGTVLTPTSEPEANRAPSGSEFARDNVKGDEIWNKALPTVPKDIVHRDRELAQLLSVLEPHGRGEPAETIIVTGPTGSGKTSIATFAVSKHLGDNPAIEGVYVNCWEDSSRFQVLYRILDQLQSTLDIHRQSTPRDVLLERLREFEGPPCAVILDEVDQLEDKALIYDLLNLPQYPLVLIANREEDLLEGVDDRLTSRLQGCERIHCQPYTEDQLIDILKETSERELDAFVVEKSALSKVASDAEGDARVAIKTLLITARRAEQAETDRINLDMVGDALPAARREVQEAHVEDLTPHQQAVFEVIAEEGEITPGDLYEEYQSRVEEPKSDRTVRDYLNKLERYDLVVADGSTRDRVYRSTWTGKRE